MDFCLIRPVFQGVAVQKSDFCLISISDFGAGEVSGLQKRRSGRCPAFGPMGGCSGNQTKVGKLNLVFGEIAQIKQKSEKWSSRAVPLQAA